MIYLLLFFEFFKIGLFTVGGGLAAIPLLYELAERSGWFTAAQLTYMIAISESSPGPIAVNMATFAGFHTAGVLGGAVATLGSILPGAVIVVLVSGALEKFRGNRYVQAGFKGVRPAVAALVSVALVTVARISLLRWDLFVQSADWGVLIDYRAVVLFCLALFGMLKFRRHPVFYIVLGTVVGIFIAP